MKSKRTMNDRHRAPSMSASQINNLTPSGQTPQADSSMAVGGQDPQTALQAKMKLLDETNTKLAAALMVGLSTVRGETLRLKKQFEVSQALGKEAQDQANEMEKLVQKYMTLNGVLLEQNKALRKQTGPLEPFSG
eukprot:c32627_g1_i1.p1 GENE.c32627_g1_i1~~c32627_g1_i1.p1  ORF type:complete len:135 (-),score=33.86 c32627_g1_i1:219-623(-)